MRLLIRLFIVLLVSISPAIAEIAGGVPLPANFWEQVWGVAQAAGLFGTAFLGYILWRVDKERVEFRDKKEAQTDLYIVQMKLDAVARAKTEELAQKYILGVEAMNETIKKGKIV